MLPDDSNHQQPVPTGTLMAYLMTVLAWELEIVVLLVHAFANEKLDPLGHGVLLLVAGSLTLFAWFRGRKSFELLRWTRGRIRITPFQAVMITMFMIAFGGVLGWAAMRLVEG